MKIIEKIVIKDFRSISSANIPVSSGYLPIIGQNNSGKSNILRALNLFFNNETEPNKPLNMYEDFHNPSRSKKKRISVTIHFKLPDNFSFPRTVKKGLEDLLGTDFSITKTWTLPSEPLEKNYKLAIQYKKGNDDEMIAIAGDEDRIRQFLALIKFRYIPNHIHPSTILQDEQRAIQTELLSKLHRSKSVAKQQQEQIFSELRKLSKEFVNPIMSELKKAVPDIDNADLSIPSDLGELLFSFAPRLQVHGSENINALFHGSGIQSLLTLLVLKYLDSRFSSKFGWHQATIWAIEEPESFLHKDLEYSVANLLSDTGKSTISRFQTFCTTHSDVFVRYAQHGMLCQLRSGKTAVEEKEARKLLDESVQLGVSAYVPPLLFGAPKPLLIVEGLSDKLLVSFAYSLLKIACPWEIQDIKTISCGTLEGVEGLKKYLRINNDILKSRSLKAPVFVLIDWNESASKVINEIRQLLSSHPTSDVLQWSTSYVNTELDVSFTGIERYLSTEVITEASKKGFLILRKPVDASFPLSVDRHKMEKIEIAKFVIIRKSPQDAVHFRQQLIALNEALSEKQRQAFMVESGRLF